MDRGYYSETLMKNLIDNGLNYIFRVSKNLKLVDKLNKSESNDLLVKNNGINSRIVKYTIHKEPYYLLTNLLNTNKYNLEYLKISYKLRWTIETDFKYSKYYLSLKSISSKNLNNIKQDIALIIYKIIYQLKQKYFVFSHTQFYRNY